jgi:hypothetical protein
MSSTSSSNDVNVANLLNLRHAVSSAGSTSFVVNANALELINDGSRDPKAFEPHGANESWDGIEGRDWMKDPYNRLVDGPDGFDFALRVGRRRVTNPGSRAAFNDFVEGRTIYRDSVSLLEIYGNFYVVMLPKPCDDDGHRLVVEGTDPRWNM